MRALKSLLLGMVLASSWPAYFALLGLTARNGPWPRSAGVFASTLLWALAIGMLARGFLSWFFRPGGWVEGFLEVPANVVRQFRGAGRFLTLAGMALLTPAHLFAHAEIAHEGHALTAATLARFLILGFEVTVLVSLIHHLRPGSALMLWINPDVPNGGEPAPTVALPGLRASETPAEMISIDRSPAGAIGSAWVVWLCRRARTVSRLMILFGVAVIALDALGYTFASRRMAFGGLESLAVFTASWVIHRLIGRLIDWRTRSGMLTARLWEWAGAASLRSGRPRGLSADAPATRPAGEVVDELLHRADWASRLSKLSTYTIVILGLAMLGWVWGIDPALLRFLAEKQVWPLSADSPDATPVLLGDLLKAVAALAAGATLWRYMAAIFAYTLFRKIPDDPGVRFAAVTLCRYAVLAVALMTAMEAIHLGMAQISMIVAALGVGLGFGLQEIVSNFICGIILLLERPIRVGDVVTVGDTTGKVDRINIRATTIINGDNQCMIVPNREFITGKLVNWTHKDKIMRVGVRVSVAHDSNVDQVVKLLLSIAQGDFDVLSKPAPSASLEEIGETGLKFALFAYVADPGLMGGTKHRIGKAIQERFAQVGIVLSSPSREVTLAGVSDDLKELLVAPKRSSDARFDPAAPLILTPHVGDPAGVGDRRMSGN